ncbi:predicted ABC-type polysaccharide/polyol phosphate export system, ATP-binding protein [Vibrio mediterranei AK1]|uniref:ABC transporter ATP-binding protein n=1 Tax=Vibrio mediterranei TaxID=689 RepID=UPI0001541DDB|nr:ATP-binding cassette domain-containing protein [Vibrio mediterranei]EDL53900.1 predicted ABC-type polysaccharide/polyol phosphate export system, ATP-binding protein [Vibrio mediterranei AK1]
MSKPVITLENIAVTYKSGIPLFKQTNVHTALKDISFELHEGDSLGIIGRNGVGKSTLLNLLNGIIKPDKGRMINHGYRTALLSLSVGYDNNVSGYNNAIMSGMLLGRSRKEMISLMPEIIEFSELGNFIYQPVKNYSTGMKQRLGFSVATQIDTDVLLIDEILGVGDARFKKKSTEVMKKKILSGDTVVLVSHSAATIKKLCNKAVWIEKGVVKASGDPVKVVSEYEKYITK